MWMMMWDVLLLHRSVSSYLGKSSGKLFQFYYEVLLGWIRYYLSFRTSLRCCAVPIHTNTNIHTYAFTKITQNGFAANYYLNKKSFWTPFIDLVLFTTIDILIHKLFKFEGSIIGHLWVCEFVHVSSHNTHKHITYSKWNAEFSFLFWREM